MTFGDSIRTCLREKYVTFSGRASRSEYWWFQLFYVLVMAVLAVVVIFMIDDTGESSGPAYFAMALAGIVFLGFFLPILSVTIRRIHDLGYSGWWYLAYVILSIIPYIGWLVSIGGLVFVCLRGTVGPNQFGDDPLNPGGNLQEVFS